jgi:hypothetical protein
MKNLHNNTNMLHLVGSAERDDDADAALAGQLSRSRTEIYKWADASTPDTEASQGSWDRYTKGWGEAVLPTPAALGHVSISGAQSAEEVPNVIDLASRRQK